jgi:hypothetical protein
MPHFQNYGIRKKNTEKNVWPRELEMHQICVSAGRECYKLVRECCECIRSASKQAASAYLFFWFSELRKRFFQNYGNFKNYGNTQKFFACGAQHYTTVGG